MDHVIGFRCMLCGAEYGLYEVDYVCPLHGDDGILDVVYDYEAIGARLSREALAASPERSIWRYKALLPVAPDAVVPPLRVGWTPLYPAPRLAERVGLKTVWVKDDGVNPTASFKDRASALAVVKAQAAGAEVITTASTGNAAAALAGLAASVGLQAVIFVPKSAPPAKIAQHLIYGARVLLVDGSYGDAFELTLKVAREFHWYNRNTAYNPFMTEGKKTAAYEICEQLEWQAPDVVFVPVGDGCIIGGMHKGFKDLLAADSICASLPRDRAKALAAVRQTGGAFLAVSDAEILGAIPTIAQATGVFCEPAAAASYAGLVRAVDKGMVSAGERVVLLLTGSGLKDVGSAMKTVAEPPVVMPTLDAVRAVL